MKKIKIQILKSQLKDIEQLYEQAKVDFEDIIWEDHHPKYPKSLSDLMYSLACSDFMHSKYNQFKLSETLTNIDNSGFEEVCSLLTSISRSERWSTGAWIKHIEQGTLNVGLDRLNTVLENESKEEITVYSPEIRRRKS